MAKQYTLIVDGEDQMYEGLGLMDLSEARDAAQAYVEQGNSQISIHECIIEDDEVVDLELVEDIR